MKKIISTLLLVWAMVFSVNAQIVITEISYNTPSVDVEFIELFNNSANMVDMSGWSFSQGVDYTFPAGTTVPANGYLLVALDSIRMQDYFGVAALQWTGNSLSNSGEDIVIIDDNGVTIDSVDYEDNTLGWPSVCDGQGPSLILCDVNSNNNDPANWGYSTRVTGTRHGTDSSMLFCSPGIANGACPTVPAYLFNGTYEEVSEGAGSVDVGFIVAHTGPMDSVRIDLTLDAGASTATAGMDFTYTTVTTGVSPEGVGGITFVDISVPITDDMMIEGDETIVFNMGAAPVNGVVPQFLPTTPYVVKIIDNDVPLPRYNIDVITADANNDGEADSLGVRCEVQGVVHGIDLQGGGSIQFTIIDSTGGIGLFSGNDFMYTVTEGDEVLIPGLVGQFNGLAQMTPDTVIVVSMGNALATPRLVTELDETTESELVQVECFTIIDTADWPTPGTTGSGRNIDITNGTDTLALRIDNDVDLFETAVPASKWLTITGIGGQFDSSVPRTSGYQLLPRYAADLVELGNPTVDFMTAGDTIDEAGASVSVSLDYDNGNPDTTSVTVSLVTSSTATQGTDFGFSDTTFTFDGCGAAGMFSFDVTITEDMDVEGDETVVLAIATTNSAETTVDTFTLVITDNDMVSISDQLSADAISLYPNPARDVLVVQSNLSIESIMVMDLLGKEVMNINAPGQEAKLSVAELPKGTYVLRAQTDKGVWTGKWVKM
ncbi:MAG: lamin tail domain-containing protein [Bacteroidota bacterium]